MSLYGKDFLKDNGQGGDEQFFYGSMDNSSQADSAHPNGFSFGQYGGHGSSQLGQRGLPPPAGLFRSEFPSGTPQRAPGYPASGSAYAPLGSLGPAPSSQLPAPNSSTLGMLRFGIGAGGFQGARGEEEGVGVEDFPALPSANPHPALSKPDVGVLGDKLDSVHAASASNAGGNASVFSPLSLVGGAGVGASMADRVRGEAAPPTNPPVTSKEGRYGLAGLVEVSKATDKDIHTLSMGMDLTTFGLNLNAPDSLYLSFASPFADATQSEPPFNIPQCYNLHPPALKTEHLSKFHLETLFYMFYQLPRDILQACAAQELYRRDWKYHAELRLWLKPRTPQELSQAHPTVQFVYFDAKAWEVRLFNAAQVRGNLKAGLVSEEEIRVKPPLPPIGEPS